MSESEKPQPEAGFDGKDTVRLVEPVKAYGELIDKLVFRRAPSAKDLQVSGMPYRFNMDGEMVPDVRGIMKLAERLTDVPYSTIETLTFPDLIAVQGAIMSFLDRSRSTSSTATTTSPGNGELTPTPFSTSALMSSSSLNGRPSV